MSLLHPDDVAKLESARRSPPESALGAPFGATAAPEGVFFRLWAPACDNVSLLLESETEPRPMQPRPGGFFEAFVPGFGAGTLYRYLLPNGMKVPDPASRFQPGDVDGPSEVIDPAAYAWSQSWAGRPWDDIVLYELHVGAFTPEGTFRAAAEKLDHLAQLGVTAIEIMPVADFQGRWNWGYDGALLYAPDSSYGRPEDFKSFVEAAHARGVAVLLDVVYNHFGPAGNYLRLYAPSFFTDRHKTPWGDAINYDGEDSRPVRDFVIANAQYWIDEFHLDGLRLDAVHAIADDSPKHILDELAERLRATAKRPLHLIVEDENNEPRRLRRHGRAPILFTAQWNDDVHHVLHVAATEERAGYYEGYLKDGELLGKALAEGFAYQGQVMPYRGRARGAPSAFLPPGAFVAFIQNHDQVGNRAFGERLNMIARPEAMRALAAVYLLLPQAPMIFMGEEWGAEQPFLFFCDFSGDLAEAVREGRRAEFARFPEFADPAARDKIPDPVAESAFLASKLDWRRMNQNRLAHYRALLKTRRRCIAPLLPHIQSGGRAVIFGPEAVRVRWQARERILILDANLCGRRSDFPPARGRIFWSEGETAGALGPWSVRWSVEAE
ncbi:MAG TPA: malto-oligosyltrehalose trehalohydrolase [Roseiarcus sp.]|nr:malto-oligosyltrehalose trehalohydrolase [Roseiarcus sp.]